MVITNLKGEAFFGREDEAIRAIMEDLLQWAKQGVRRGKLPRSSHDDAVQEVLVRFLEKHEQLVCMDEDHLRAWLRSVLRNVVAGEARHERLALMTNTRWPGVHRIPRPSAEDLEDLASPEERALSPDSGPLNEATAAELRGAIPRAFDRLPVEYREELERWFRHGETCSEVARRLGRPRYRVSRGLARSWSSLRRLLRGFWD